MDRKSSGDKEAIAFIPDIDPKKIDMKKVTKVKKQMEYYFSDSNIENDSFLRNLIFENPERYVQISVFFTFNKIKSFDVTQDELVYACYKSRNLQLSPDGTMVRSKTPFKTDPMRKHRIVNVTGFDVDESIDSISSIIASQVSCKVNRVELVRSSARQGARKFNGEANIELSCGEEASRLSQTGVQYKGSVLNCTPFVEWRKNLSKKSEENSNAVSRKVEESPAQELKPKRGRKPKNK